MTKVIGKVIVKRTKLQTKCFKTKTQKDYALFEKQIHICSKLYKQRKMKIPWKSSYEKRYW